MQCYILYTFEIGPSIQGDGLDECLYISSTIKIIPEKFYCKCCGKEHRQLPPGSWISTISGWHTVRIRTDNCLNESLGCNNDVNKAVEEAWNTYNERFLNR